MAANRALYQAWEQALRQGKRYPGQQQPAGRPAPYDPQAARQQASTRLDSYDDPIRSNMTGFLRQVGVPDFTTDNVVSAAEWIPGVGDAMDMQDAGTMIGDAWRSPTLGNIGKAGAMSLAAILGIAPGGGDAAAKALKATAKGAAGEAGRMVRAQDMGFRTGMPLYHGTTAADDFTEFRRPDRSSNSQYPGDKAIFLARDPAVASEFASGPGSGQRVLPLYHRAGSPAQLVLDGSETNAEIASTLDDAFAQGKDSVLIKNYTSPGGKTQQDIIAVRDPSQVRSVFAQFDPSKKNSADLLAGLAAAGVIVLPALVDGRSGNTNGDT